jgi:hypothetical protein
VWVAAHKYRHNVSISDFMLYALSIVHVVAGMVDLHGFPLVCAALQMRNPIFVADCHPSCPTNNFGQPIIYEGAQVRAGVLGSHMQTGTNVRSIMAKNCRGAAPTSHACGVLCGCRQSPGSRAC